MMKLLDILKQYRVTSPYGNRQDPFGSGKTVWHTGVDLVGKECADPIESFCEGEVIYAGDTHPGTGIGGFGWVVLIKDRNNHVHMYAHLQANSLTVKVGDHVVTGQQVGLMGSTGKSTGKHLHYEVRSCSSPSFGYGNDCNPLNYLVQLCQDSWVYYNRQGRKEKCEEMHATAEYLRAWTSCTA